MSFFDELKQPAPRWSRERFGDYLGGDTRYLLQVDIRW